MVMVASRFLRYIPEEPMRGPDVREVQTRLRSLGFYQGPLDGVFGRAMYDAVVAFQARRQLPPDGVVGPDTYAALGSPPTPQALGRGPTITIDLERRRLYFMRRNVPQRMYDVAVGAPATPTPVGRWVVVEKAMNPGGPFGSRWIRINIPWGGYPMYSKPGGSKSGTGLLPQCGRAPFWHRLMRKGASPCPMSVRYYRRMTATTPQNLTGSPRKATQ